MNLAEKISNAELEVMRILWREGKPVPFSDIRTELQNTTDWEKSTINTLIRRLADKGVIAAQKQNVLYGGSAKKFVAALCNRGQLSEDDIDELKAFFKMGGSKE